MLKKSSNHNSIHHLGHGSFKDFFIPHSGNDYKPKALHPKRVLFHISAALAVKAIILAFVFYYPLSAWMTPDVAAGEGRKIISLTNGLRSSLSLVSLTENSKLDLAAAKKVDDMFINQYFAHSSPSGLGLENWLAKAGYANYVMVGENLAVGYNSAEDVMAAWKKSPSHYDNLVDPNFSQIGVALAGGQFQSADTVFIAQYFGLPLGGETVAVAPQKTIAKVVKPSEVAVLAQKATTKPATKITVSKPAGPTPEKVVKVETILPPDTKAASANILNTDITLQPQADGNWQGQDIIMQDDTTIVPPSLSVIDASGSMVKSDILAANVLPEQNSLLDQYWLYRAHPNTWMAQIFTVSSIYFKIILVAAIIALLLTIFINRKKQHPRLIASGLGLIAFMTFLIIF